MAPGPFPVQRAFIVQIGQQPAPQNHVRTRRQRQVKVRGFRCGGPARIDVDDLGAALFAAPHHPLVPNRMAPGHVAADLYDRVGFLHGSS